jgi:hypothetical protein
MYERKYVLKYPKTSGIYVNHRLSLIMILNLMDFRLLESILKQ